MIIDSLKKLGRIFGRSEAVLPDQTDYVKRGLDHDYAKLAVIARISPDEVTIGKVDGGTVVCVGLTMIPIRVFSVMICDSLRSRTENFSLTEIGDYERELLALWKKSGVAESSYDAALRDPWGFTRFAMHKLVKKWSHSSDAVSRFAEAMVHLDEAYAISTQD